MKHVFTFILCLVFALTSLAQQEVFFNINHKLGTQDFAFNTDSENDLGNAFVVDRLEYYISEITVNHDGTTTQIQDLWILAKGDTRVSTSLGMLDVTDIESVSFHIGVNEDVNHDNPALWPNDHPLAPQAPSMHWGWSPGYRFVAMEGKSNGVTWQLHGLGDSNYFETTVEVEPREENGVLHIDLDGNYTAAVNGVKIANGPISHGDSGEAKVCLVNFNENVFSQAGTLSNTKDQEFLEFNIYPNPSLTGLVGIDLPFDIQNGQIKILSADGRLINSTSFSGNKTSILIEEKGVFVAQVISSDVMFATQTLIIQ